MLDFPTSPYNGQQFAAPNGVVYQYTTPTNIWTTAFVGSTVPIDEVLTVVDFGAKGDGTTDDRDAFTAAAASGKTVYVPVPEVAYLIMNGNIVVMSDTEFIGLGHQAAKIMLGPSTASSLFDTNQDRIAFRNLWLVGNRNTQPSATNSAGISSGSSEDIIIDGCLIEDFVCDGILLDGATRAIVSNNTIRNIRRKGGIVCARNAPSTDIQVRDNNIFNTGEANIHALVGVTGWTVTGNHCDTAGVTTASDNITGYTYASASGHDYVISNNVCRNSANNGIHVTAYGVIVTNNTIRNPAAAGIAVQFAPIPEPDQSTNAIVTGNDISFASNTVGIALGIVLRDVTEFVISGNIIRNPYTGIRVQAYGTNVIRNGAVIGNVVTDIGTNGIEFQTDVSQVVVDSNIFQGGVSDFVDFSGHTPSENQIGANNFSVGATNLLRRLVVNHGTSSVVPSIRAIGSAPDISMRFVTKGTGVVSFGTYTATPGAITGYITITDAGGTVRKLAVTS